MIPDTSFLKTDKKNNMETTTKKETFLFHHTSEDTAYFVEDYPYGFTLRTHIRYWVETHPKLGDRFCSQTMNPKTGKWNKPKKGTYSLIVVLVKNEENGYITQTVLGRDRNPEIDAFIERVGKENLNAFQIAQATAMIALNELWAISALKREATKKKTVSPEVYFDSNGPTGHGDICYSDADPGL